MATRRPLLAGNWKMHGTRSETERLLSALTQALGGIDPAQREIVVAPPFSALETAARLLAGTPIRLAAQNLHWEPHGAFTGEVSGPMLKEAGCAYVILGHSERRQYFAETDESVARKVRAAQRDGLLPIVCVGESLEERESGATLAVIDRQIRGALYDQDLDQAPGPSSGGPDRLGDCLRTDSGRLGRATARHPTRLRKSTQPYARPSAA